jgi:hypothetical protein
MPHAARHVEHRTRGPVEERGERQCRKVPGLTEAESEVVERLGPGIAPVVEIHDVERRERRLVRLDEVGESHARVRQDEPREGALAGSSQPFGRTLEPAPHVRGPVALDVGGAADVGLARLRQLQRQKPVARQFRWIEEQTEGSDRFAAVESRH